MPLDDQLELLGRVGARVVELLLGVVGGVALGRAEGRPPALAARLRRREEVPVVGRQHLTLA